MRSTRNGLKSTKLRVFVLFFAIQVVLCSQKSILLPIKGYIAIGIKSEIRKQRNYDLRLENRYHDYRHHQSRSTQVRGGGISTTTFPDVSTILVEFESFFRDNVISRAREVRERFQQRMHDHLERKSNERQKQLKRNKIWRETAESPISSLRQRNSRNRIPNRKVVVSPSSYASSSLLESNSPSKASLSFRTKASLKTISLPIWVVNLSLMACIVAEILDQIRVLDGDTPGMVWARIEEFWKCDVLPAYANVCYKLDGWFHRRVKRWILKFLALKKFLERSGENILQAYLHTGIRDPHIWSTTKTIFAISTACGIILGPMIVSSVMWLWRPVLVLAAISETNHYFKMRGRKFVEFLGETPQTLGATLDNQLERCRKLVMNVIRKIVVGSEKQDDCYYEGYGSGRRKSGAIHDRYGDNTAMGLMGGVTTRKRSNYRANLYSLGISAYRTADFDKRKAFDTGLHSHKRRALARQGLLFGYVLGLLVALKRRR